MTLKKIIRKLKLKFYDANQDIPKIIGQYNLIGSFLVLAVIILNFGFNNFLVKEQNSIILIVSIFYITSYFIRGAVYVNFVDFIKKNKLLSFLILLMSRDLTKYFLPNIL